MRRSMKPFRPFNDDSFEVKTGESLGIIGRMELEEYTAQNPSRTYPLQRPNMWIFMGRVGSLLGVGTGSFIRESDGARKHLS